METFSDKEAASLLPARPERSNKYTFGRVLLLAGSKEMPGAAALACSASYAAGAGLVCAAVVQEAASVIHHWQREAVTRILPGRDGMYCKESIVSLEKEINSYSVILLGPGIGRSREVTEFVFAILGMAKIPLVLDADALFAVSADAGILKTLKAPCVITPHFGEMSRLTGLPVTALMENPKEAAVNFARENNVVTLLKDAHTVIANPAGDVCINKTGCNALSKAGTGDVLAGMTAGFIAQGCDVFTAAKLGAFLHGKAGEAAARELSNYAVTASDVIRFIPDAIKSICL